MRCMKIQGGFVLSHLLLLILLLGGIGGVSRYVWQKSSSTSTIRAADIMNFEQCVAAGFPIMESQPPQCAADGRTFTAAGSSSQQSDALPTVTQYLAIKEWAVRLPVNEATSDAIYLISGKEAFLSTKRVMALSSHCAPDKTSLGYIGRYEGSDRIGPYNKTVEEYMKSPIFARRTVLLDGYYYHFQPPQAACADQSQQAAIDELGVAFDITKLEPIPTTR